MEEWTAECSESVQECSCLEVSPLWPQRSVQGCLCVEVCPLWPQGSGYWLEANVFGGENSSHDPFHTLERKQKTHY